MDDIVNSGRSIDTLDKRGNSYGFYSSSGSNTHHGYHHYLPYNSDKQ